MIEVHTTRRVHVVCLSGEIDMATAPALSETLTAALRGERKVLAIECEALRFIDIAGTRPLAVASEVAATRGITFVILNPSSAVARVLEWCDLQGTIICTEGPVVHLRPASPPLPDSPQLVDLSSSAVLADAGRRYLELPLSRR